MKSDKKFEVKRKISSGDVAQKTKWKKTASKINVKIEQVNKRLYSRDLTHKKKKPYQKESKKYAC